MKTNTWKIIKDVTGQSKIQKDYFPYCLIINKSEVTNKKIIAEKFNKFFIDIGVTLATNIPKSKNHFTRYLSTINSILDEWPLTENEFKNEFF